MEPACDQVVIVHGGIQQGLGQAAAGRTAGLDGLELLAVGAAAADVVDDGAQGGAHGNFHQTGVVDLAAQSEHLGALGLLGAHGGIPVGAVEDDLRHVGVGLHVVEHGGLLEQALHGRERRTGGGLAALALDGVHQSGFLAADESAGAETDEQVEVEAGLKDVLAQEAVVSGLLDGDLQTLDGDGVLSADVDVAFAGADGIAGNGHGLDDGVRIAFQDGTVHERAGVALVSVAGHVLLVAWLL